MEFEHHHVLDFDVNNKNRLHNTKAKPREKLTRTSEQCQSWG